MASCLQEAGHELCLFDYNSYIYQEVKEELGHMWMMPNAHYWETFNLFKTELYPKINQYILKLVKEIIQKKVEAVGFSVYTSNSHPTRVAISLLKKLAPDVKVFYGGARIDYNTPLKDTTMMGFGTLAMSTRYALGFLLDYEATNRTESQLLHRAQSCVDYQLGANPQSMSFITGLGSKYPMHPQHQISEWDGVVEPVPGISVYGAADGFPFK